MAIQRITVLGATGSIGQSTLSVVRNHPERFEVFALTARGDYVSLLELIREFKPTYAVLECADAAKQLRAALGREDTTEVLEGPEALVEVARSAEASTVVAAIVGAAGLQPTMAAVVSGKRVLLANKESLVMAGRLFVDAVIEHKACLLPVDSEHNAIFQCLPQVANGINAAGLEQLGVRRLILTGSGGPFRQTPLAELAKVTPEQACAHPNWSMGRKISVDSATMMNKGLEFIEACWLFGADRDAIQVVIHPQSVIHSMVEYVDGSVLAQMGQPDMRTPIAHCLGWPNRLATEVASLDFWQLGSLDFEAPDYNRFPLLRTCVDAMAAGGTCPALLNAANEVAVAAFLARRIGYSAIARVVDHVLQTVSVSEPQCLAEVIQADTEARSCARRFIEHPGNTLASSN